MRLEDLGTVVQADLLVIGHGIAGTTVALAAKDSNPELDVLLVDKASAGWAGKANKGGCVLMDVLSDKDAVDVVEWHVRKTGEYLNDQDMYLKFVRSVPAAIDKIDSWGANITRNSEGRHLTVPGFPAPWTLTTVDADFLLRMTKTAKQKGCRFMEKVSVTDLLTKDGKVIGAVGFSMLNGEKFIFQAKAVVLANGNQNYRATPMWSCARGDGLAAAYRAGCEMRNGEFGTFRQASYAEVLNEIPSAEDYMFDAAGNYLSPKYRTWLQQEENLSKRGWMVYDSNAMSYVGMYLETKAGNGPIYYDVSLNEGRKKLNSYLGNTEMWQRKKWLNWKKIEAAAIHKGLKEPDNPRQRITATLIGEDSPLKVDKNMATTLPGLWAAGDVCYNGSGIPGAVPAPPARLRGSGIIFAICSALFAAPNVVDYISGAPLTEVEPGQAAALLADAFSPMERAEGIDPYEVVSGVRKVMAKVEYSTYMRQDRLEEGLALILAEKAKLPKLKVSDYHYLAEANEARSFVLCAEMHFRTAMLRKESRGWFIREDYPERDDENWLKCINFRKGDDGEPEIWYERVPIEKYPFQINDK